MLKRKILVIDDEENFARLVKLNLEGTGEYEVKIETDGKRGLATAREYKPDLIFLDIIMPDIDGGDLAHQIRSDPDLNTVPVVFLTAIVKEDEVSPYGNVIAGHPFIAKPVTLRKLIDCINKHIGRV